MKVLRVVVPAVMLMMSQGAWAQGAAPAVPPMAADAKPGLDVATIKPSGPDAQRRVYINGTRLFAEDSSLMDLMMFAYLVHPAQIVDGPDWMKAERFDVVLQADLPGRPSTAQFRTVMQQMLADRFGLGFHHAQRELAVYRLIEAKGGPKITPATEEDKAGNTAGIAYKEGEVTVANATVSEFASLMQRYVGMDRPIVNDTGIAGKYDFKLKWTPDFSQGDGSGSASAKPDENAPSLYTAMQEQLGLKLEAVKEPTDVMVVDRVEKPSEN